MFHHFRSFRTADTDRPQRNEPIPSVNMEPRLVFDVESLETRQLLAGNVAMSINGAGDLRLNGDSQDNHVEISMAVVNGEFVGEVRGLAGTTIQFNGQQATTHQFELAESQFGTPASVRDVRVSLGGGDDNLRIVPWLGAVSRGFNVGRDLRVNLGTGDDTFEYRGAGGTEINIDGLPVFLADTYVVGDARIAGQSGNDTLEFNQLTAFGSLDVLSGAADGARAFDASDLIEINDSAGLAGASIVGGARATEIKIDGLGTDEGDLVIRGGGGHDDLLLDRLVSGGDTRLDLGSGVALREILVLGNSRLNSDLDITGGGGSQRVIFSTDGIGLEVDGTTDLRLGGNNDEVVMSGDGLKFFTGDVSLNLGGGNDILSIMASTFMFGDLAVSLGAGSDDVAISGAPLVSGDLFVQGGAGFDEVENRIALFAGGTSEWVSINDVP